MTRSLAALLTLCAVTASAQTVRAPALGRSALPGVGALSAVTGGLTASAVSLPTGPNLAAPLSRPVLPSPALQAPRLSAPALTPSLLPLAGEGRVKAAAVLETASVPLARAAGNPSAQAPVLSSLFEGGRSNAAGAVLAAEPAARPSSALLARNAVVSTPEETPPPPPARPVWKTAGLYALRTAAFLGAFAGGFRVGDMVYLGAQFLGPWGLLSLPVLGAAAWWLGRRKDASPLGRSVMGGVFASAGLVVVGQQVWDLVHSPLGLLVGVPVGILLALAASGLLPRRKR